LRAEGAAARPQRGKPQSKKLNRSKQRKQRKKDFAKNAQLSDIALCKVGCPGVRMRKEGTGKKNRRGFEI
jgi:hypothetical protein